MKKIIMCLIALLMSIGTCCAEQQLNLESEAKYQKKVMEIGFRILNSNQIDKRMTFYYAPTKSVNASASAYSKQITIYKGILPFMDNDDELAAVICHEIVHGVDFHSGFLRRMAMNFNTIRYERKADVNAVDYMVNAGYNPVAIIVILNKITDEPTFADYVTMGWSTHPKGSDRLVSVYEYIYTKYPAYLADNDYKNNVYYQNFLLTSKKQRNLVRQKYQEKNITPVSEIKSK